MVTHNITLLAGWHHVVETQADGTVLSIGSFRTETDARGLAEHLPFGREPEPRSSKVGFSNVPAVAPAEPAASDPASE